MLLTFRSPISLKVHPVTSLAKARFDVLLSLDATPPLTLASNQVFSSISAEPSTVNRAEFLACMAVTKANCSPTPNGSSTPSASSFGL